MQEFLNAGVSVYFDSPGQPLVAQPAFEVDGVSSFYVRSSILCITS